MERASLAQRVWDGVMSMGEGEKTSVGKIATVEGVSKSPQLYRILGGLVATGYLSLKIVKHSNGHDMHQYTRTSLSSPQLELPFERQRNSDV